MSEGVGGFAVPGRDVGFQPGFVAFSTNPAAGAFTGFHLELSRPDGDQALSAVSMHLPEGVAAMLSSVELCSSCAGGGGCVSCGERSRESDGGRGVGHRNRLCRKVVGCSSRARMVGRRLVWRS